MNGGISGERDREMVGEEERKGGGDGGSACTSTSAKNCFLGEKCIIMKAEAGQRSTANTESQR